ncbi:hypothetical protein HY493_02195 [Candidatus Woesearchaeota archaeon]|nr:hypothetical protein [Candidatus Woesearchaeota archaeon]
MIVMLIVVLAAAAIVLVIVYKGGTSASAAIKQATPAALRSQIATCKISSSGFQDTDKDKLADFCDPCLGGNDFTQSDQDFVADKCDKDTKKTAASPMLACCNEDPGTETDLEKLKQKCPRLVNIDPFQCCAIGATC